MLTHEAQASSWPNKLVFKICLKQNLSSFCLGDCWTWHHWCCRLRPLSHSEHTKTRMRSPRVSDLWRGFPHTELLAFKPPTGEYPMKHLTSYDSLDRTMYDFCKMDTPFRNCAIFFPDGIVKSLQLWRRKPERRNKYFFKEFIFFCH